MMRTKLVVLFYSCALFLSAQNWSDKTRILPNDLRKIPVALYIIHSPNPNYPETNDDKSVDAKYVWKHRTSVYSPHKNLTVVKAGSYIWYNEEGWKSNVEYDRRKFAKRFKCPRGKIIAGEKYTFEKNYRWGNNLYGGDALWYVIAEDDDGKLYKGIGLIETESELKN